MSESIPGPKLFYSDAFERAVIGSVLIDTDLYITIPISEDGHEFHIDRHKFIWRAFGALRKSGSAIDYLTVCKWLETQKPTIGSFDNLLEEVGGPAAIMSVINTVPSSLNADAYAREVINLYDRRELIRRLQESMRDAYNEELSIGDVVTRTNRALADSIRVDDDLHHWRDDIRGVLDYVDMRVRDQSLIWGIPTGLSKLDYETGGLQRGWLIMLAGAPGAGKSLTFRQIARQVAAASGYPPQERDRRPKKHNVALFSLEMSDRQVTMRDLSAMADVPTRALKTGMFDDDEQMSHFVNVAGGAENLPIYQTDRTRWTPAEMRASIARLKARLESQGETLDLVGIDYLYLMVNGVRDQHMKDFEKAEYLSGEMKTWAGEFNVPVIAINSMTKDGFEDGAPQMGSMKGGGQMHHNADLMAFITKASQLEEDPRMPADLLKRMRRMWIRKGRDLEDADFHIDLVKGTGSPWMIEGMADSQYRQIMEDHAQEMAERGMHPTERKAAHSQAQYVNSYIDQEVED